MSYYNKMLLAASMCLLGILISGTHTAVLTFDKYECQAELAERKGD